jgi:hypothetical protein
MLVFVVMRMLVMIKQNAVCMLDDMQEHLHNGHNFRKQTRVLQASTPNSTIQTQAKVDYITSVSHVCSFIHCA